MSLPADNHTLASALQPIWERNQAEIVGRVERLEEAVAALLGGALPEELRGEAERAAHKLAGSLGTFGLAGGSDAAREAEFAFSGAGPAVSEAPRLAEIALSLRGDVERGPPHATSAVTPAGAEQRAEASADGSPMSSLLIVDSDVAVVERLTAEGAARGMLAEAVESPAAARLQVARERPDAVVIDPGVVPGEEEALALIEELSARSPVVPVVVYTAHDALTDRVEVARHGAHAFIEKTYPPARAIEAVAGALERRHEEIPTVLAVDDDPTVLDALRTILTPEGVRVATLEDPRGFLEALSESAPDLVVLDVDMPNVSGPDLCRVMRADRRFRQLPAVFLTGRTDAATIEAVFAAGADDFVSKPIVAAELAGRIGNRLERVRLYRELAEVDALTGVANRRKFTVDTERYMKLSRRYGQPLSLTLIDLDRFKQMNDLNGHAAGDEVLRRLGQLLAGGFRGEDVVARWGGEEFAIAMYGMSREDSVARVADLLERFRAIAVPVPGREPVGATFSAGIALHPEDGDDLQSLYRAADRALYEAKLAGRDRVLAAGDSAESRARADVVVVEDDEALGAVLVHALETRGHKVRWIRDGHEAAVALSGHRPALSATLILLDVDLPGIDGLSLLRRMAGEGALRGTRVIMLTARSMEAEVLEALELGAVDHVAKPFSVPILMQRVRRTLRSAA